jgi:acetylornithine deacetylase
LAGVEYRGMNALNFAQDLIAFDSVSRQSNIAISDYVAEQLKRLQFEVERLEYVDEHGVRKANLVAKRGPGVGGVGYFAHTDVVPADDWTVDFCGPFEPTVKDERLWGRGSCDMKGSLACALAAAASISPDQQTAPIYIVCSADEEVGMSGARHINQFSKLFEEMVRHETVGIIGEPTELRVVHAHKGGCRIEITAYGKSAHSSTREGINANWQLIPMLARLRELQQLSETLPEFRNYDFDPPTLSGNLVIFNQPLAANVTTSLARASWFLRTMPKVSIQPLLEQVREGCETLGLECNIRYSIDPLWVDPQSPFVQKVIELAGVPRSEVVCYATDGGVLRRLKNLVVCGPGSIDQAHRSDEWIALEQLEKGTALYRQFFEYWGVKR